MADTNIEWATKVWNFGRGCKRKSRGCEGCYAERQAIRHAGPGGSYEGLVKIGKKGPVWTGKVKFVPEKLAEPFSWRLRNGRHRVFVDSMSDLFYEGFTNEQIAAGFGVMGSTPWNDYLLLTKRAERLPDWFAWVASEAKRVSNANGRPSWICMDAAHRELVQLAARLERDNENDKARGVRKQASRLLSAPAWPLWNVWLGVSAEDQDTANERVPLLLSTPAALRWVSYEPALGPVNFHPWLCRNGSMDRPEQKVANICDRQAGGIDWIVTGGESGPRARTFDVAWARDTVKRCGVVGVPIFVKQLGAHAVDAFDGLESTRARLHLISKKGGDMNEWPADLRVRQFPTVELGYGSR